MSLSNTLDDQWPIDVCATFHMYCIFAISNDILIIKNTLTLSTISNDDHWPIDVCATFRMYCIFEISNDILIIKNTLTLSTIANGEIN